ncbi:MAG: sulfotransferase family 2 domain-containing protein [Verrucomicrobia bacterium]|nr:sulfotransferase family 2 domain-containing protein [Verrucomicrobiota bacterium]
MTNQSTFLSNPNDGIRYNRFSFIAVALWKAFFHKTRLSLKGYNRVYQYHIRKTGGTSINLSFLGLFSNDPLFLYRLIVKQKKHQFLPVPLSLCGWNVKTIQSSEYFYGFSHEPFHKITLKSRTFTFTCFRDPCSRILSHYRMLLEMRDSNSNHPCMRLEAPWLGNSFDDFLRLIPREHLLNQLWMFSPNYSVAEASDSIRTLDCVLFTENLVGGIKEISNKTGLPLKVRHDRKTSFPFQPTDSDLNHLRTLLEPEYELLEMIKSSLL